MKHEVKRDIAAVHVWYHNSDGQVADLLHAMMIYGEELDWSSYSLAI